MSKHLERDMEQLEQAILSQSSMVEEMIVKACEALRNMRGDLAEEVITQERAIDLREVRIEEECLKILALHQPVAIDLRRTATILKINNDLERIADLAVNISERTQSLLDYPDFSVPDALEPMADEASTMVRKALDALVELDVETANTILSRDDVVDELNRTVIQELTDIMRANPNQVEPALHMFSASRHIERIADHATNIAEDVIYLVEGEIARHRHNEAPLR